MFYILLRVMFSPPAGVQSSDDPVPAGRSGLHHRLYSGTEVHQDRQNLRVYQRPDRPGRWDSVHPVRYELIRLQQVVDERQFVDQKSCFLFRPLHADRGLLVRRPSHPGLLRPA